MYLKSTLNPLLFGVSSYSHYAVLNIFSLDGFFDSLSWIEFGICSMMFVGKEAYRLAFCKNDELDILNTPMMFFQFVVR